MARHRSRENMIRLIGPFRPSERQAMREALIPFLARGVRVELRPERDARRQKVYFLWRERGGMATRGCKIPDRKITPPQA